MSLVNPTEESKKAAEMGLIEFISKGFMGATAGIVANTVLNKVSSRWRAIPTVPIKVALVVMSGLGTGSIASERLITKYAQRNLELERMRMKELQPESPFSFANLWHEHKYSALVAVWTGCVAYSMTRSKGTANRQLYQRIIDARLFAQGAVLLGCVMLGASMIIAPTPPKVQYHLPPEILETAPDLWRDTHILAGQNMSHVKPVSLPKSSTSKSSTSKSSKAQSEQKVFVEVDDVSKWSLEQLEQQLNKIL